MRRAFGRCGAAAALIVSLAVAGCSSDSPNVKPLNSRSLRALADVRVDPAVAAAKLSAYRAAHGLGAVRLDPTLMAMAQRQADAMVAANALSHDVAGSFSSRISAAGLDTPRAGENVGGGYYSTDEAFAGWRESSEHNANLLMPQATRFGIAIAKDARTRFRIYWAMEVAAEPERPIALSASQGAPVASQ